jgi:hypothetical protein
MKKLMIAAFAVAAVSSAFAANCTPGKDPVKNLDPWAYSWLFSGKTTTGVKAADIPGTSAGNCNPHSTDAIPGEVIRVPATLKIQGYTYQCYPECGSFGEWDKEAFVIVNPAKDAFFTGKAAAGNIGIAHVIGKKATQVEIADEFNATTVDSGENYAFTFAGLGTYNPKYGITRVTSASGDFAGYKTTPHALNVKKCPEAIYWDCTGTAYLSDDSWTVAYGKWNVKFAASAAKNYGKNGAVAKLPVIGKSY